MNEPGEKKPALHLVPHVLEDAATVMEGGAAKRRENDWREGHYDISLFTDAAQRHLEAFKRGQDYDVESGHPHLVHAFVNLMMAHELHRDELGVDDRWTSKNARRAA